MKYSRVQEGIEFPNRVSVILYEIHIPSCSLQKLGIYFLCQKFCNYFYCPSLSCLNRETVIAHPPRPQPLQRPPGPNPCVINTHHRSWGGFLQNVPKRLFYFSLFLFLSLSLSLSLSLPLAPSRSLSLSLPLSPTHTYTHRKTPLSLLFKLGNKQKEIIDDISNIVCCDFREFKKMRSVLKKKADQINKLRNSRNSPN